VPKPLPREGRGPIKIMIQLWTTNFAPTATLYAHGSHPRRVFSISYLLTRFFHGGDPNGSPIRNSQWSEWSEMLQPPPPGEDISPSWQGNGSHALPPLITTVEATQLWTNV
jgi:hypothetical protein